MLLAITKDSYEAWRVRWLILCFLLRLCQEKNIYLYAFINGLLEKIKRFWIAANERVFADAADMPANRQRRRCAVCVFAAQDSEKQGKIMLAIGEI